MPNASSSPDGLQRKAEASRSLASNFNHRSPSMQRHNLSSQEIKVSGTDLAWSPKSLECPSTDTSRHGSSAFQQLSTSMAFGQPFTAALSGRHPSDLKISDSKTSDSLLSRDMRESLSDSLNVRCLSSAALGEPRPSPTVHLQSDCESIDQFFERVQATDSLEELKKEILTTKFWIRYAFGQLCYEQEKSEHLEAVCLQVEQLRASSVADVAAAESARDRMTMEASRLTMELNRLNLERDTLLGKSYVLEERLKCLGQKTMDAEVTETSQQNFLQTLKDENSSLKSAQMKLESDVAFFERELVTAKMKCATLMENSELLTKVLHYYVSHLETCDPSLIVSTCDRDAIERLQFIHPSRRSQRVEQGQRARHSARESPVPSNSPRRLSTTIEKMRDWGVGLLGSGMQEVVKQAGPPSSKLTPPGRVSHSAKNSTPPTKASAKPAKAPSYSAKDPT